MLLSLGEFQANFSFRGVSFEAQLRGGINNFQNLRDSRQTRRAPAKFPLREEKAEATDAPLEIVLQLEHGVYFMAHSRES